MTTPLVKSTTDELIEELEAAAKGMQGWPNDASFKSDDAWCVGTVDEDGNLYPVIEVQVEQYDAEHFAEPTADYYAAANPTNVLALIARIRELERWKSEQLQVMTPVMKYAHSLKISPLGGSVTLALIDDHKRLRELERDAARYQWLREQDQFHGDTFSALNEWLWANGDFSDITAAIDAEISEQPQCPAT